MVRDENIPTPAGEVLLRHIRVLKILRADTQQQIKLMDGMRPRVAIAVNADSLATWFEAVA